MSKLLVCNSSYFIYIIYIYKSRYISNIIVNYIQYLKFSATTSWPVYKSDDLPLQLFSIRKLLWLVDFRQRVCQGSSVVFQLAHAAYVQSAAGSLSLSNSLTAPNWFTRICFYASTLQIETQAHRQTNTHTERVAAQQIMKMKRESNESDGPQDQKRNRRNEETVRILIPSSVSVSPPPFKSLPPTWLNVFLHLQIAGAVIGKGGQHIQKMRTQVFTTCKLHKEIHKRNERNISITKHKRLQKQMINWILD